ncbi:MAG: EamA family transporter, partial [Acidobacteria bacterium]
AAGGDLMTLGAALLFAVQIAGLTAALGVVPARRLLFQQIAACAAFSIVAAACLERPRFVPGPVSLGALAYLAAVATAFVFALQAYGQRRTSASRAAVLFATEPVWAAVFAALLGEPVRPRELAGGALVLAGVLAGTRRRSGRAQSSPGSHSPR